MLKKACKLIEDRIAGIKLRSPVYETEPWGFVSGDLFLNQVICLDSAPEPDILLEQVMQIENELGRKRTGRMEKKKKYSSRIIDIDILFYNNLVINSEKLIIPHPKLHLRRFTLLPLMNISKDMKHPVIGKTIEELLEDCDDELSVSLYSES